MSLEIADYSGVRQLLLQHAYLPLISVQSTPNADRRFQEICQNHQISALQVLQPYGNNVEHGAAGQTFRITNTQLITRNYGLFPVRFEAPLQELLAVDTSGDDKPAALFSISSLEALVRRGADAANSTACGLYKSMFRRIITSNRVVPFDTLNHPVAQVWVVDFGADSVDEVRRMLVEFRNHAFPRYFHHADMLIHVLVLYDPESQDEAAVTEFLSALRIELSVSSTLIPVSIPEEDDVSMCTIPELENATIEQEIQYITFQNAHGKDLQKDEEDQKDLETEQGIRVPRLLDATLRTKIHDFLARNIIPHMERKIRTWDDAVLAPKKSLAGRFFSVSRKLFGGTGNEASQHTTAPGTYNHTGNFYHRSTPEQTIRKLADWALMLKDFRYAYSAYDLIKRDYTNDKAWAYVAAAQEMCMVSLLLAQTQPSAADTPPQKPDKNTLRKIRHDIIEPYVDNVVYTYKLRLNVKTYAVRGYLVVAELLLHMSIVFNLPWWWGDLIEDYFMKAVHELETHLNVSARGPQATRAILYARLGFVKRHSYFVPSGRNEIIHDVFEKGIMALPTEQPEEGFYQNHAKLPPSNDTAIKGLTRFRQSGFWYIMSMKEWMMLENAPQIRSLMDNLSIRYAGVGLVTDNWFLREDLVLAKIKQFALPLATA